MKVAGIGFRGAATVRSIRDALERLGQAPDALATVQSKAQAAPARQIAQALGLELIAVSPEALAQQTTLTQSPGQLARFGTGSLCEAAALAAAGDAARLLGPRVLSKDGLATAALAQGDPT